MFSLLTLPRGVPIDPELPHASGEAGAPVGIVIRPGPAPVRVSLREAVRAAA